MKIPHETKVSLCPESGAQIYKYQIQSQVWNNYSGLQPIISQTQLTLVTSFKYALVDYSKQGQLF